MAELRRHQEDLACDLCYSRKIKCDRQQPCHNCVVSKRACCRTRQRRNAHSKPRTNYRIQALVDRISNLEDSLYQNVPTAQDASDASTDLLTPSTIDQIRKRKRSIDGSTQAYAPFSDSTPRCEDGARAVINGELSLNKHLSAGQRTALRSALISIDELLHEPSKATTYLSIPDQHHTIDTELGRGDILYLIIANEKIDRKCKPGFQIPDFLSRTTIKRMGLHMLDGRLDKSVTYQYKVILHFKAAVFYHDNTSLDERDLSLAMHIEDMKTRHLRAALAALKNIGILTSPSLDLLQAFIAGAIITVILGDVQACLALTQSAARTIVALGYHHLTDVTPRNETDSEIHWCIAWCYQFDTAMSMLLFKPQTLPKFQFPITSLIHSREPGAVMFRLFLELAQVQEGAMKLALARPERDDVALTAGIDSLCRTMITIYTSIQDLLHSDSNESDLESILYFRNLEFTFHSIMTMLLRLNPRVSYDIHLREKYLSSAREALRSLKGIQDILHGDKSAMAAYQMHLSWPISTYPLCTYFVIFCRVVCTGDTEDFRLLQDIAAGLSTLPIPSTHISRLHKLCATLVRFCEPFFPQSDNCQQNHTSERGSESSPLPGNATHHPRRPVHAQVVSGNVDTTSDSPDRGMGPQSTSTVTFRPNTMHESRPLELAVPVPCNDDLMWQLFSSMQPREWYNSDIFDSFPDIDYSNV